MRCTVRVVFVLGMLLVSGCRKRSADEASVASDAPPPPLSSAQDLLREVSKAAKGRILKKLTLRYVRPDGQMDTTYGEMRAEVGDLPAPPPADDPNRPIGAPEPPRTMETMAKCKDLDWSPGGVVNERDSMFCGTSLGEPKVHQAWRCSVAQLWERARKDGAPEGLAVLAWETTVLLDGEGSAAVTEVWKFSITDGPRNISFEQKYRDDCTPVVERAPS